MAHGACCSLHCGVVFIRIHLTHLNNLASLDGALTRLKVHPSDWVQKAKICDRNVGFQNFCHNFWHFLHSKMTECIADKEGIYGRGIALFLAVSRLFP